MASEVVQSGSTAWAAFGLPSELAAHLCRFLQLKHQFKLWLATRSDVIWQARRTLNVYAPQRDELGATVCVKEKEAVLALCAVSRRKALLANIQCLYLANLSISNWRYFHFVASLHACSRLTKLSLRSADLRGAPALLTTLEQASAPLRCLELSGERLDYEGVASVPLTRLRDSLVNLSLHTPARQPAPTLFLEYLADQLPNLKSLLIQAETWKPLKRLNHLTHLYVVTTFEEGDRLFDVSTVEAAAASVARLLEMNPPLVGAHLMLDTNWDFYTILEAALDSRAPLPTLKTIVTQGNYNLLFTHDADRWNGDGFAFFLSSCQWSRDVFEYLFIENSSVLAWRDDNNTSIFSVFFSLCPTDENFGEMLRFLFDRPWAKALELGYNPTELMYSPEGEGPRRRSVLFDRIEYFSPETFKYICSRPDAFGEIRLLRDQYDRSLLFEESSLVAELIAAGLDWRDKDALGFNALEHAALKHSPEFVEAILGLLSDEEFVEWCTPTIWAGLAHSRLTARMKALVPRDQWKPCIQAALHLALAKKQKVEFHRDEEIKRVQLLAWLEPIDWDFISQYWDVQSIRGQEAVDIAEKLDDDASYVRKVFSELRREFGHQRANKWARINTPEGTVPNPAWCKTAQ